MSWHFLLFALAAAQLQAGTPNPVIRVLPPEVRSIDRDVSTLPADHFRLLQAAGRVNDQNRADYLARMDRYVSETLVCGNPEKTRWALELAYRTYQAKAVRESFLPRIDRFVIEQPACFLDTLAILDFSPDAGEAIDRFLLDPATGNGNDLQAAVRPLLIQDRYAELAPVFDQRIALKAERDAREAQRQRLRLAYEASQRRAPLKDRDFLASDPPAYWALWEEVSANARDCEDPEAVADLLDAAVMHASLEGQRQHSAEFVELLAIDNPACVLGSMEKVSRPGALADYLADPMLVPRLLLLAPLAYSPVGGEAAKQQQRFLRLIEKARQDALRNSQSPARFLKDARIAYRDEQGRILIDAPRKPGTTISEERLAALWEQAEPAGTHGD